LEVIRGDWTEVAKKVQEHVLEIILNESSPKKAIDYVRSEISFLRNRKVPLRELIIWKTLIKPPEDYAIKAPHVEAAKMLMQKGWRLRRGDKVGYLILTGKGSLYNRVKPYVFAKPEEVDVEYYITNQVLPATIRILSFFNVTEAELLKETKEIRSLMDYF
jgi:DNA polymerase I